MLTIVSSCCEARAFSFYFLYLLGFQVIGSPNLSWESSSTGKIFVSTDHDVSNVRSNNQLSEISYIKTEEKVLKIKFPKGLGTLNKSSFASHFINSKLRGFLSHFCIDVAATSHKGRQTILKLRCLSDVPPSPDGINLALSVPKPEQ